MALHVASVYAEIEPKAEGSGLSGGKEMEMGNTIVRTNITQTRLCNTVNDQLVGTP